MASPDVIIYLCGCGPNQRKIFTDKLKNAPKIQARILDARGSMFKAAPMAAGLTHIVVDCDSPKVALRNSSNGANRRAITPDSLKGLLVIDSIAKVSSATGKMPHVVTLKWLVDSIAKNAQQIETEYLISVEEEPAPAPGSVAAAGGGESDNPPLKRQRQANTMSFPASAGSESASVATSSSLVDMSSLLTTNVHLAMGQWTQTNGLLSFLDSRIPDQIRDSPRQSSAGAGADAGKQRMVAFDMDGTLITTKSGAKFAKNADDWKLFDSVKVKDELKRLHNEGVYVAIISNQAGIGNGKTEIGGFKMKVENILQELDVPCDFICCTAEISPFRKPLPGMWELLRRQRCPTLSLDATNSLYVGDAAGREAVKNQRKKDFSDSDVKLAWNVGAAFQTPEHFFQGNSHSLHANIARPDTNSSTSSSSMVSHWQSSSSNGRPEIVILVAPASSGKSTFCANLTTKEGSPEYGKYEVVNQDTLGSVEKCLHKAEETIVGQNKSVLVDNTNTTRNTRGKWIHLAKRINVNIRCIEFVFDPEVCKLLNVFRQLASTTEGRDRRHINTMAFNVMFKALREEPVNPMEGFSSVQRIPCVLQEPQTPAERCLWNLFIK
eukprot:GSChrysophyteH2.ASY1.ANO1.1458.1 assembled CDS